MTQFKESKILTVEYLRSMKSNLFYTPTDQKDYELHLKMYGADNVGANILAGIAINHTLEILAKELEAATESEQREFDPTTQTPPINTSSHRSNAYRFTDENMNIAIKIAKYMSESVVEKLAGTNTAIIMSDIEEGSSYKILYLTNGPQWIEFITQINRESNQA